MHKDTETTPRREQALRRAGLARPGLTRKSAGGRLGGASEKPVHAAGIGQEEQASVKVPLCIWMFWHRAPQKRQAQGGYPNYGARLPSKTAQVVTHHASRPGQDEATPRRACGSR